MVKKEGSEDSCVRTNQAVIRNCPEGPIRKSHLLRRESKT